MSKPQCLPFRYYQEVMSWKPGQDDLSVATVKLAKRVNISNDMPRTLICHDMRGGYLQDK